MQSIKCSRWMPYPVEQIYLTLTDPNKLAAVVKRLHSVRVLDRHDNFGSVIATLDLPGGKFIETKGKVVGEENKLLMFSSEAPFPLEIKWEVAPDIQAGKTGTQVTYTVSVDFSPLVAFVSGMVLKGFLGTEMEQDLDRLNGLLAEQYSMA